MVVISRNLPQKRLVRTKKAEPHSGLKMTQKSHNSNSAHIDDLMWFLKVSSRQIKQIDIEPIEIDAFIQASQFTKE